MNRVPCPIHSIPMASRRRQCCRGSGPERECVVATRSTERKLAAIMVADITGFSRLMERDESQTFARLRQLRDEVAHPKVAEHGGRIVKSTGDGFLAEF